MDKTAYTHSETVYYRCGICDHWHNINWNGDCREDAARFHVEDLDEKHGSFGWTEVDMPT